MFIQKKIIFTLLKYQIRSYSFITPVLLLPTLFITFNYNRDINFLPFILMQNNFLNPSRYYNISEIFLKYYQFGIFKRIVFFAITNFIWYNIFYFFGFIIFNKEIYKIIENYKKFEIILLSAIIIGSIFNLKIIKESNMFNYKVFFCYFIFTIIIYYIHIFIRNS
jgi:hypothetical protein